MIKIKRLNEETIIITDCQSVRMADAVCLENFIKNDPHRWDRRMQFRVTDSCDEVAVIVNYLMKVSDQLEVVKGGKRLTTEEKKNIIEKTPAIPEYNYWTNQFFSPEKWLKIHFRFDEGGRKAAKCGIETAQKLFGVYPYTDDIQFCYGELQGDTFCAAPDGPHVLVEYGLGGGCGAGAGPGRQGPDQEDFGGRELFYQTITRHDSFTFSWSGTTYVVIPR